MGALTKGLANIIPILLSTAGSRCNITDTKQRDLLTNISTNQILTNRVCVTTCLSFPYSSAFLYLVFCFFFPPFHSQLYSQFSFSVPLSYHYFRSNHLTFSSRMVRLASRTRLLICAYILAGFVRDVPQKKYARRN